MANKIVIYHNIDKCCELTDDFYWKDIIHSCACNKFPKGIRYEIKINHPPTLYVRYECGRKFQNETFTLTEKISETYSILMFIFKNLLGLRSPTDIEKIKLELEVIRKTNNIQINCEWKKLKPRSVKNHILMNYAITRVEKLGLESRTANNLYRLIQLGFQFKNLTPNNINYKEGKILAISGLDFDKQTKTFKLTNSQGSIAKTNTENNNKINQVKKTINKWVKDYKLYFDLLK